MDQGLGPDATGWQEAGELQQETADPVRVHGGRGGVHLHRLQQDGLCGAHHLRQCQRSGKVTQDQKCLLSQGYQLFLIWHSAV